MVSGCLKAMYDERDGGARGTTAATTPWDGATCYASTGNLWLSNGSIMGRASDDASSSDASRAWVSGPWWDD